MVNLKNKSLITTQEWSKNELDTVLEKALEMKASFKKGNYKETNILPGHTLLMIFFSPSTRTRNSFEVGMTQLGGKAIFIDAGKSWLGRKSESIKDTVKVLSRYGDSLAIRIFPNITKWKFGASNQVVRDFEKYSEVPIINLEDDLFHPCQALADIMTLKEKLGDLKNKKFVLSWAYHPFPLPISVPNSTLLIMTRFGLDVTLAHPSNFELDDQIIEWAHKNAEESGGSLDINNSIKDAYKDADIIYVKSWGSLKEYGNPEKEKKLRVPYRDSWICNEEHMDLTKKDSKFMHCMPIRRNTVATDSVCDGDHSIIYDQAENRLHAQKGLLVSILKS
ncbi:MAG: N-acetylornithine carbamoyltransferase [Candidatus Lokiarchaeota archaeon]|nr:N-acetylornithine carbamoyltransferase [Candidatus Lokiarchaeota archaeon]